MMYVASTGIEPVSGASETLILSIVLRGLFVDFLLFPFTSQTQQYWFQIFLPQWRAILRRKIFLPQLHPMGPGLFQSILKNAAQ